MNVIPRLLLMPAILIATLFGSAGRWDLPFFWAWIALFVLAAVVVLATLDRDLLRERIKPGPGGTDRHLRLFAMPFFLAHLIVAGLDVGRFHFSDSVPTWLQVAGLAGSALGFSVSIWSMHVNRFFSPVVRIQSERGHYLITHGPYRCVRHPGYLSAMFVFPLGGLALGSWWALAPVGAAVLLLLRRTIIEDRFLQEHLAGYQAYTQRVRFRLVPGLW